MIDIEVVATLSRLSNLVLLFYIVLTICRTDDHLFIYTIYMVIDQQREVVGQ